MRPGNGEWDSNKKEHGSQRVARPEAQGRFDEKRSGVWEIALPIQNREVLNWGVQRMSVFRDVTAVASATTLTFRWVWGTIDPQRSEPAPRTEGR